MLITQNSAPTLRTASAATANVTTAGEQAPKVEGDVFKKTINGAAYAAGGALGGLALGAVSGKVMSHLTGNDVFSTFGGGVGAIGGAATSLALSLSDQPVSIARTFGSWAGASAGTTAGMYLLQNAGAALASHGAASYLGSHGALIGAVAGGVAGAGVAFVGDDSKLGAALRTASATTVGATAGFMVGGVAQALFSQAPAFALASAVAPFVGAAAVGSVGLNSSVNPGWTSYGKIQNQALNSAAQATMYGGVGFGGGMVAGAIASAIGGGAAYGIAAPALGAAVAASLSLGDSLKNDNLLVAAGTLAAGGLGAAVGDAVGQGLTALTGQSAFLALAPLAGGVNGAASVLRLNGMGGKYLLPTAAGLTTGTLTGTLLGAGLTALTGQSAYQLAGTAIGAAAGLFAGLAAGVNTADKPKKSLAASEG